MLYLISTPIGNLEDMTFRAVNILRRCTLVLCEDTRHSSVLLRHYEISTQLLSLHKFNEAEREEAIIDRLRSNESIALISDAGMPGLCDPGERLIMRCVAEDIPFTVLPGASAPLTGLILSGFAPFVPFQFVGFIPKALKEREETLLKWLQYSGNTIAFESAGRTGDTLEELARLSPNSKVAITRELTKLHEEALRGTPNELLAILRERPLRGEVVIVIASNPDSERRHLWTELSAEEHVRHLEEAYQISKKDALKMAAEQRGVPKRELYQVIHKLK